MKTHYLVLGVLTAGCLVLPRHALAQVSTDDFNALKKSVEQMGEKVQKLEQTHEQDQKAHEEDQKKIQGLQQQLGETQTAVTNVDQKADAVARVQSSYPVVNASPGATHNFTMVGDAEVQFGKSSGQHSGFLLADFAPIFLFRASDNVLFEAGFDVTLQNGTADLAGGATHDSGSSTSVSLSFAQLDYLWNDYVTAVGGYMVLPLGTYSERTAGWLNKIPDDPLARDFLPGSGVGAQLRGALPVGEYGQMLTYSIYGANGPSSVDGSGNSTTVDANGNTIPNLDLGGNVGVKADGNNGNLHANPSGGGRIGWFFPWEPHYDIELGISGQSGEWSDSGNRMWSGGVVDASVHISPYFEVKGEYISSWVQTDDLGTIRPRGYWVQAGYKLAGLNLELPYIHNVELVGRYDRADDALGTKTDRYTVGYVYYLSNTLLFEGAYEFIHSRGPNALPPNSFVLQLSYGF